MEKENYSMGPAYNLTKKKCEPCTSNTKPLTTEQVQNFLKHLKDWELQDNCIEKLFKFERYVDGLNFINSVAKIAESEGHHPDIFLGYRRVRITLTTHAVHALSENDFIIAAKIDEIKV